MNLPLFIAGRYLFARKSHSVINIISAISAAGIAIGCAALVIILSIYNGFDSVVQSLYTTWAPDLEIKPLEGKYFTPEEGLLERLSAEDGIFYASGVLEESVYLKYGERQSIATARGVDSLFEANTKLRGSISQGEFELRFGSIRQAVLGRTLAYNLGVNTRFMTPLELYFPSNTDDFSLLDPTAVLRKETLFPQGIVSLDHNFDQKYIFVPLASMRSLLAQENGLSSIELFATEEGLDNKGFATKKLVGRISDIVGPGFSVKDRRQQNSTLYKLLSAEKGAIYLILLFIMVIISFNILGSLRMLIIEKSGDVGIMRAMGADEGLLRRIFVSEGWLISLIGIAAGIAIGLIVCLLQQRFGFVKMPGNFVVEAYPVVIKWSDVLLTAAAVAFIGYVIALIPARGLNRKAAE